MTRSPYERPASLPDERARTGLRQLVASIEPGVVFRSLAVRCVPQVCDECSIELVGGSLDARSGRHRFVHPPRSTASGGLLRIADRADGAADHRLRVPFASPTPPGGSPARPGDAVEPGQFRGAAVFVWHRRAPTRSERTTVHVLVEHAVHLVLWQRSEQAAGRAAQNAANLQMALLTSRHIGVAVGILMSRQRITQDEAFDALCVASQNANRKLRDVALDVVERGCLDDAAARASALMPPVPHGATPAVGDRERGGAAEQRDETDARPLTARHVETLQGLGALDRVDCAALRLIYWHGRTQAQVAAELRLPIATIRTAVARGMRQLAARLNPP